MRRQAGYTVFELLVVCSILGLLVSVAMDVWRDVTSRERHRERSLSLLEERLTIDASLRLDAAASSGILAAAGPFAAGPDCLLLRAPTEQVPVVCYRRPKANPSMLVRLEMDALGAIQTSRVLSRHVEAVAFEHHGAGRPLLSWDIRLTSRDAEGPMAERARGVAVSRINPRRGEETR